MMGTELHWRDLPAALEPEELWRWTPGMAFSVGLYLATRHWPNPLVLPVGVTLAVAAYHAALAGLGIDGAEAGASGLLFDGTMEGALWPALGLADLALVDWPAFAGQLPNILTLMLVALVCVTMNTAGLELATGEELDWDREFQATGLASVVGGLGGGAVGSMIVSASLRSKLLGAATRLTGIVAALPAHLPRHDGPHRQDGPAHVRQAHWQGSLERSWIRQATMNRARLYPGQQVKAAADIHGHAAAFLRPAAVRFRPHAAANQNKDAAKVRRHFRPYPLKELTGRTRYPGLDYVNGLRVPCPHVGRNRWAARDAENALRRFYALVKCGQESKIQVCRCHGLPLQ